MSGGYTPGPWSTHQGHVYAPDGAIIALVRNPGSRAEHYPLVANAHLIAAAPELLSALSGLMDRLADVGLTDCEEQEPAMAAARAAIAKARGDA